jgi:hypothetical protein
MSERMVNLPVKEQTRGWIINTKGELSYDEFFNKFRSVLERTKLKNITIYAQVKNEDGLYEPLQKLQSSKDDGGE